MASVLRGSNPPTLDNGLYPLATAECIDPYTGDHVGRSIYVVGMGTPDEQFFARSDRAEAVALARSTDQTFDHLPAGQVCASVVETLFGPG